MIVLQVWFEVGASSLRQRYFECPHVLTHVLLAGAVLGRRGAVARLPSVDGLERCGIPYCRRVTIAAGREAGRVMPPQGSHRCSATFATSYYSSMPPSARTSRFGPPELQPRHRPHYPEPLEPEVRVESEFHHPRRAEAGGAHSLHTAAGWANV